ncbi:hypothetical protein D3C75_277170 [compost metagenome]
MQQLMISDVGGCENLTVVNVLMLAAICHDLRIRLTAILKSCNASLSVSASRRLRAWNRTTSRPRISFM